jgi:hypothetical protein
VIASGNGRDTSAAATLVNGNHIIDTGKLPSGTVVHARGARSAIEQQELHGIDLRGVVLVGQGKAAAAGDECQPWPRPVVESRNSPAVLFVPWSE